MLASKTLVKIEYIKNQMTFSKKEETVCDGLAYGYFNARFPAEFDRILQNWSCHPLSGIVEDIAKKWDGENYLSGVVWTANRYFNEVLKPQINLNDQILAKIDEALNE